MIIYFYKAMCKLAEMLANCADHVLTYVILKGNGVDFSSFHTNGVPYVKVAFGGVILE